MLRRAAPVTPPGPIGNGKGGGAWPGGSAASGAGRTGSVRLRVRGRWRFFARIERNFLLAQALDARIAFEPLLQLRDLLEAQPVNDARTQRFQARHAALTAVLDADKVPGVVHLDRTQQLADLPPRLCADWRGDIEIA